MTINMDFETEKHKQFAIMPEQRYDNSVPPDHYREKGGNTMKKPVRIMALVLCLAAALLVLSSCGSGGVKASDQSGSPLIGTWIAREKGHSDFTFNADGTGYLQRGEITEKMTFADKGDGIFEMIIDHVKAPIKPG
jgi:hypothetical protein